MRAVALRDKIQAVAGIGVQGGMYRLASRHRNRRRRQAFDQVGVVGRLGFEIRLGDIAVIVVAHAVNHGRVGLQRHAALQAADHNACNKGAFIFRAGLFFDNRGQDQRLVGRINRQIRRSLRPFFLQYQLHLVVGPFQQRDIGHVFLEEISIREKQAFGFAFADAELGAQGFRRSILQRMLDMRIVVHFSQDVVQAPAFRECDAVLAGLAFRDLVDDLGQGQAGGEFIFAGLQLGGRLFLQCDHLKP